MSSEIAIRAENIGKRYRIGTTQGVGRYRSLREELVEAASGKRRGRTADERDFWALKDVSFEVEAGETVGIIGRNGAGKSTILKILSRITPPTTGRGETVGRVGSLLEVGTGFHPELTGRENIMLSGAIMGLRSQEVRARFDDIVEFSGLAQFLDTPVKRYSSGMYMRLAFSVAAHLEPEILLVDEVLAVGDAAFQGKSLGKMEGLSRTGRTVIFVSHSMPSVLRLCDRVILLDGGQVAVDGTSAEVVSKYLDTGANSSAERVWPTPDQAPGDHHVRLRAIRILDPDCNVVSETDIRQPTLVEVEYWNMSDEADFRPVCVIHFHNGEGISLFQTHDATGPNWQMFPRGRGLVRLRCRIPGNFLAEGRVLVSVDLSTPSPFQVHAQVEDAAAFHVTDRSSQGDGARGPWSGSFEGAVRPLLEWEQLHLPAD